MKHLLYTIIDFIFYFLNAYFRKSKRRAIKRIYNLLADERIDISWKRANYYLTATRNAMDLTDIKDFIIEEIKRILHKTNRSVDFYDERSKWFNFGDVKLAIGHSSLDNTQKDILEHEIIVLRSIAKEFDLSA